MEGTSCIADRLLRELHEDYERTLMSEYVSSARDEQEMLAGRGEIGLERSEAGETCETILAANTHPEEGSLPPRKYNFNSNVPTPKFNVHFSKVSDQTSESDTPEDYKYAQLPSGDEAKETEMCKEWSDIEDIHSSKMNRTLVRDGARFESYSLHQTEVPQPRCGHVCQSTPLDEYAQQRVSPIASGFRKSVLSRENSAIIRSVMEQLKSKEPRAAE